MEARNASKRTPHLSARYQSPRAPPSKPGLPYFFIFFCDNRGILDRPDRSPPGRRTPRSHTGARPRVEATGAHLPECVGQAHARAHTRRTRGGGETLARRGSGGRERHKAHAPGGHPTPHRVAHRQRTRGAPRPARRRSASPCRALPARAPGRSAAAAARGQTRPRGCRGLASRTAVRHSQHSTRWCWRPPEQQAHTRSERVHEQHVMSSVSTAASTSTTSASTSSMTSTQRVATTTTAKQLALQIDAAPPS